MNIVLPIVIIVLLAALIFVWRRYRSTTRKITFMFNALDNADYSFKFATDRVAGKERYVNESLNQITRLLINARDRTIEREKFYERIINSVTTGILVVNSRGNILQCNAAAHRLTGIDILTHTDQLGRTGRQLQEAVGSILPNEKRKVTIDNEVGTVSLLLQASTATFDDKTVKIVTLDDINTALDQNEIDSWISLTRVLTHEIMNTVAPISSLSETLLARIPGERHDETREGLEVISQTCRELLAFVKSYRRFTHIPTPVPQLFYVEPFVRKQQKLALEQAAGTDITVSVDVEPKDLILYADEGLTGHVVTNILKNAVQAIRGCGRTGGHITIAARTGADEAVTIAVTNNGPLIDDETARHIFVPFFTTKPEGSGIGLSIARQIMRLSGGTITLKTDRRAGTTTFELKFP